jgi:hypothetical protein
MNHRVSFAVVIVLLGAIIFSVSASEVPPSITWDRTYSVGLESQALDIIQTRDGGYVIAGYTMISGNTTLPYDLPGWNYDAFLIRTDDDGNVLWNRTYGTTSSDGAYAVRETGDGGFIIAGYASGEHGADRYLVRTYSSGGVLWEQHFTDNPGFDTLYGVCELPNGDFIVAGETDKDQPYGNRVPYLARTERNGTIIWEISGVGTISGGSEPFGYSSGSLDCAGDAGYLLVAEGGIIRTNDWGAVLWTAHHDAPVTYARLAPDGGAIATGITQSPETGYIVPSVLKTDASGWTTWETLSPDVWGSGHAVEVTPDQGFLLVGTAIILKGGMQADKTIPFNSAITLVKTDKDGLILWNTTLSPAPFNEGMMVRRTTDNGYIVLGNIADEAGQEELFWMGYLRGKIYVAKLDSGNETNPVSGELLRESPSEHQTLDTISEPTMISSMDSGNGEREGERFPGVPIPLCTSVLAGITLSFFIIGRRRR